MADDDLLFFEEILQQDIIEDPVVDRWFQRREVSILFGESGTGKSALALSLALHVSATNAVLEWMGYTVEHGVVVYVSAEAPGSAKSRVRAFAKKHGSDFVCPKTFCLVSRALDMSSRVTPDMELLTKNIKALVGDRRIMLVIIDTVSCVLGGKDENLAHVVSQFIEGMKWLSRELEGAHVMAIHHTGKDPSRKERGSYAFRANADASIETDMDKDGNCKAKLEKQRDGEIGLEINYRMEPVEIGVRKNGEPMTCVVAVAAEETIAGGVVSTDSTNYASRVKWACCALQELGGVAPHGKWQEQCAIYTADFGPNRITKAVFGKLLGPLKAQELVSGGGDGQQKKVSYMLTDKGKDVATGVAVFKNGFGFVRPLGGAETETVKRFLGGENVLETENRFSTNAGTNVNLNNPIPIDVDLVSRLKSDTKRGIE